MKMDFRLIGVANYHPITKSSDRDFVFLIQRSALLCLKEDGILNEMQYRMAEEMLLRQDREEARAMNTEAIGND